MDAMELTWSITMPYGHASKPFYEISLRCGTPLVKSSGALSKVGQRHRSDDESDINEYKYAGC